MKEWAPFLNKDFDITTTSTWNYALADLDIADPSATLVRRSLPLSLTHTPFLAPSLFLSPHPPPLSPSVSLPPSLPPSLLCSACVRFHLSEHPLLHAMTRAYSRH